MAMCAPSRNVSLEEIRMSSEDLLEKQDLDAGGFGMVSLCFHRRHGLVVLKTVYTGPQRTEYNDSLLAEGKIMHRLNHDRILKLLGLILEDGNYSLVMEYMKKGNLMNVLKTVTVPFSVKARFIMEIIEGMCYLNEQHVIHKDLKPDNILVDDDFHIKIADLGVASFKAWSKLTKEETNRQRKLKSSTGPKTNAGTLFFMAPEHLKSVHARPTEKSDVYSFGIVLWVIWANKEPYENALAEKQVCFCIVNGDRPETEETWPPEVVGLMQRCWDENPDNRPPFVECDRTFRPFYSPRLEMDVEKDVDKLKREYPIPKDFVRRMESLQLDCVAEPASCQIPDPPQSLHSSQGLLTTNQVDESQFSAWESNMPVESEEDNYQLERKLQDELSYHQRGSRLDQLESQPPEYFADKTDERSRRVFQEASHTSSALQKTLSTCQQNPLNHTQNLHSAPVHSMDKAAKGYFSQPVFNNSKFQGAQNIADGFPMVTNGFAPSGGAGDLYGLHSFSTYPISESSSQRAPVPESTFPGQLHMKYDPFPQNSTLPEMGTTPPNPFQKGHFGYSFNPAEQSLNPLDEPPKSISLSHSTGIQIGNNNVLHIVKPTSRSSMSDREESFENMGIFECTSLVAEQQLDLVRDNLGKQWKTCARKLGLRDPEIDEIDHDYERDGLREKVYQMLQKWQMREGTKGTTVGKLAKALYDCHRTDLLNDLISLVSS
ncbi:receptor-interacting serine/threonine-protein kinase 1 isoform X2 [Lissotriton helveticus]